MPFKDKQFFKMHSVSQIRTVHGRENPLKYLMVIISKTLAVEVYIAYNICFTNCIKIIMYFFHLIYKRMPECI
jgi:hypothetical protein